MELVGFCAFVIAQPVLDVFGKSPETFAFWGASPAVIVAFGALVTLAPPAALWLGGAATRPFGAVIRRWAHLGVILALSGFLTIQVLKRYTGLRSVPLVALGLLVGSLVVVAVVKIRSLKEVLHYSALAGPAFLVLFLAVSPTSRLVFVPEARSGSADRGTARPVSIVFVVLDQLPTATLVDRRGRINELLYPNFAALAGTATWYRRYSSSESFTNYAVPTLLTGRVVTDRSKAPLFADHRDNVFTLLDGSHRMHVDEAVTGLCPAYICAPPANGAIRAVHSLLGQAGSIWADISLPNVRDRDITAQFAEVTRPVDANRRDERRREPYAGLRSVPVRFRSFVEGIGGSGPPTLHFFHLLVPHYPWNRFSTGRQYHTFKGLDSPIIPRSRPRRWSDDAWPVRLTRTRHLLQVQYADALLGVLLQRLERTGLFDKALVVITADHGHAFQPGKPRDQATAETAHEVLWVPLIIKEPGQRRGVMDDRNLMAPDVLPTIADILNVRIPWRTDGRSADDPAYDRGSVKVTTAYADPPRVPGPDRRLAIRVDEGWRRIVRSAFAPMDRTAPVDLWPFLTPPGGPLVGKPIPPLRARPSPGTAVLDFHPALLNRVQLGGNHLIPALVAGRLEMPSGSAPDGVGVALNGRVAGVSTLFAQSGISGRFMVLIPEQFFRSGWNELVLFAMDGDSARRITFRSNRRPSASP